MGIEEHLGYNVLTTSLEKLVDWGSKNSLWPATFGLACCAIEMICHRGQPLRHRPLRHGGLRASPRQADLMIVAGTVCKKMMPAIQRIYDQMTEPKWVIAMGACATSGGIFDSYAVVQGIDLYLPVDVYIPGCPPRPEGLLYGILKLHEKILQDPFLTQQYRDKLAGPAGGGLMHLAANFLKKQFPAEVVEMMEFRGDTTVVVKPGRIREICQALRDDDDLSFRYLAMIAAHGLRPAKPPVRVGL